MRTAVFATSLIVFVVVIGGSRAPGAAGTGIQKIVFARPFPNPGQIVLYTAAADGSDERPLLQVRDWDYDGVWSPDGATIVFTSERDGSADLYRVKPDGSALERLTDDPAYDDQAAFSPDGKQLVFVSTRNGGFAHLWTMDVQSRRARALTTGTNGDYRPSWSPDGNWIAFSSDRGADPRSALGRWERLQLVDLYVIHPDGAGLKRIGDHGNFCGSPKWTADSRRVIAYCMGAEQTLANRRPSPEPGNDTRLVSFDLDGGKSEDLPTRPGVKFNPSVVGQTIAYIRKDTAAAGIYYADGRTGPKGSVRDASWSPDGKRIVFHRRETVQPTYWKKVFSRNPSYELTMAGILPSFNGTGDRFVFTGRPTAGAFGASVNVGTPGTEKFDVLFSDPKRNVLAPQWSPGANRIIFGVGVFNAFFNGFNGLFLKPEDRVEGGAQIAVIQPDGKDFREVTSGPNNNAFPSMSPDGRRFVYRSFGPESEGLRIMNLETKAVTTLTNGYDNFPLWSPRGDLIMFSRLTNHNYDIYTIKPDGTSLKALTSGRDINAHQGWSPDGEHIVFASSRMGFKDEVTYTDMPQPYGELFVMRYDGTDIQQLTDNQWEDGTPAWRPNY